MTVQVFSNDVPVSHKNMRTAQLRGAKRVAAKLVLRNMKPKEYEAEQLLRARENPDTLLQGNAQGVKSVDVNRKARSEALAQFDLDPDHFKDLFSLQQMTYDKKKKSYSYIQCVGRPLQVYLFSIDQLRVVKCAGIGGNLPTLFADATGSVVKKIPFDKQVLYYAGVIIVDGNTFPVMEYIGSQHDAGQIASFLIHYRHHAETYANKWPLFKDVVTDFSFAIINGACLAFNHMDLSAYLRQCHKWVTDTLNPIAKAKLTRLRLCCAHLMKNMADSIGALCDSKRKLKRFVLEVLGAMYNMKTYKDTMKLFGHLTAVLKAPTMTSQFRKSLAALTKLDQGIDLEFGQSEEADVVRDDTFPAWHATVYESSPFYQEFVLLVEGAALETDASAEANEWYVSSIIELIMRRWIPYLPLWSLIMDDAMDVPTSRPCNAAVEGWFSMVKNYKNPHVPNTRITRFVKDRRKHTLAIHTRIEYAIPKRRLCQGPKPVKQAEIAASESPRLDKIVCDNPNLIAELPGRKRKLAAAECRPDSDGSPRKHSRFIDPAANGADNALVQETWAKKAKPTRSYFTGNYLQSLNARLAKEQHSVKLALESRVGMRATKAKRLAAPVVLHAPASQCAATELVRDDLKVGLVEKQPLMDTRGLTIGAVAEAHRTLVAKGQPVRKERKRAAAKPAINRPVKIPRKMGEKMPRDGVKKRAGQANKGVMPPISPTLLPNGLFADPSYYMGGFGDTYVVALIKASESRVWPLYFRSFKRLYWRGRLDSSKWLDDTVIDLLAYIFFKDTQGEDQLVPIPTTSYIFEEGKSVKRTPWQPAPQGRVFLPLRVNKNHWVLGVADLKEKSFAVLDSAVAYTAKTRNKKLFGQFKNCTNQKRNFTGWSLKTIRDNCNQDDSANCGVFVLRYIWAMITGGSCSDRFDPVAYREHLARLLLIHSEPVYDLCYICGVTEDTMSQRWIDCDVCKRWFHCLCIGHDPSVAGNDISVCHTCIICTAVFGPRSGQGTAQNLPARDTSPNACVKVKVVNGSYHQGDERFSAESVGRQCTAIAAVAVVVAKQKAPCDWVRQDLDAILSDGDALYRRVQVSRDSAHDYLAADDLPGEITVNKVAVRIELDPVHTQVQGVLRPGVNNVPGLLGSLNQFFSSANAGILTANDISVAIGHISDGMELYWCFDSHSRDSMGIATPNGTSCLALYEDLSALCTVFIRNVSTPRVPKPYSVEAIIVNP